MNAFLHLFAVLLTFAAVQSYVLIGSTLRRSTMRSKTATAITIADGVEFDTIAREWRLKWTPDDNKRSLASVQQTVVLFTNAIKNVEGVKSVQRVVCGGCLDYKVIIALEAEKFAAWEEKGFSPEADFLASLKAIPGITNVETQTYTIMPVL